MENLARLYGHERSLEETSQVLHFAVRSLAPHRVGAMHVTCADEAEIENIRAFERGFVQFTLPSLKSGLQSPFTLANLGARYEWGSVRVAENHFTDDLDDEARPLLLVKINAHCGCESAPDGGVVLGHRHRYGHDTLCCGLLAALMQGSDIPAAQEVRALFASEGVDRLGMIGSQVDPSLRPLVAAIVSARLQARAAMLDIADHAASTRTAFLVLACVSLNRPGPDTELLVGSYLLDARTDAHSIVYRGLGDDPSDYRVRVEDGRFRVFDDHVDVQRCARDHRALVRRVFLERHADRLRGTLRAPHFEPLRRDATARHDASAARRLLRASVPLLAETDPVPAAVLFFAEGAAGVHHVFDVHRLARGEAGVDAARRVLRDVHSRVDRLPPGRATALVSSLAAHA